MVFDPQVFEGREVSSWKGAPTYPSQFGFRSVRWSDQIVRSVSRARGSKRAGLDYERKVIDVLSAIYGASFTPAATIRYTLRGVPKAAILDGILRLPGQAIIVEVKLAHTERVWEQLMDRYLPLVRTLEPEMRVRTLEICRSYDPAVVLPGPHTLIESLHRSTAEGLEVMKWKL